MPYENQMKETKECPSCGQQVKLKAVLCKHCHATIADGLQAAVSQPKSQDQTNLGASTIHLPTQPVADSAKSKNVWLPAAVLGLIVVCGVFFVFRDKLPATGSDKTNVSTSNFRADEGKSSSTSGSNNDRDSYTTPFPAAKAPIADAGDNVPSPSPSPTQTDSSTQDSTAQSMPPDEPGRLIVEKDLAAALDSQSDQQVDANESENLNKSGLAELKAKNYRQAIDFFSQAHNVNGSDAKYLSNLGYAETKVNDLVQAKSHLLSSLKLAPDRAVAWGDLGEVYAMTGDKASAVYCFHRGFEVSKGDTLPYIKSLAQNENHAVADAANAALDKIVIPGTETSQMPLPGRYIYTGETACTLDISRQDLTSNFLIEGRIGDQSVEVSGSGVFTGDLLTYRRESSSSNTEVSIRNLGHNKLDVRVGSAYVSGGNELNGVYEKAE
jgi:hypothetical protein